MIGLQKTRTVSGVIGAVNGVLTRKRKLTLRSHRYWAPSYQQLMVGCSEVLGGLVAPWSVFPSLWLGSACLRQAALPQVLKDVNPMALMCRLVLVLWVLLWRIPSASFGILARAAGTCTWVEC